MSYTSTNKIISINELWQFFNRSATLFCIAGTDGYLTQVNPYVLDLFGFPEDILLSTPFIEFINDHDRLTSLKKFAKIGVHHPVVKIQNRVSTISGECKWIAWTATYIASEGHIYLIGQDRTDTQLVEEKLFGERSNRHKNLLEATFNAQEREREEIGKELHDNINQMLATVMLYQQMALEESATRDQMIHKASEIIGLAISEIRDLSKNLTGPNLKYASLLDCLDEMVEPIKKATNFDIKFQKTGDLDKFPLKLNVTIFRIIQEQLNNIIKHAEASLVSIKLQNLHGKLTVTIADNGKGFDQSASRAGIGLNNIRSRVEIFNGTMMIKTAKGKGCCLNIDIPVD